jgi:aldose 1-epimerase
MVGMSLLLTAGDDTAVIDVETGGRLASLRVAGRELLLQEPRQQFVLPEATWGCFLMAPFAGRIRDGIVEYDGRKLVLPRNFPPHAIHGAVFDVPWRLDHVEESIARLSCEIEPERWPFGGTVRQEVRLEPGTLVMSAEVVAEAGMPAWIGWHPWFLYRSEAVRVTLDSDWVLETSDDLIPSGRLLPVDDLTDLRHGANLAARQLDHTCTSARSPAFIRWPDLELEISFAPPLSTVVVHSPEAGFCVEPQSAWPDAARLEAAGVPGTGIVHLEPGGKLAATMRWSWRARQGGGSA